MTYQKTVKATVHPVDRRTVPEVTVVRNESHHDSLCDIELRAGHCRILLTPDQAKELIRAMHRARNLAHDHRPGHDAA